MRAAPAAEFAAKPVALADTHLADADRDPNHANGEANHACHDAGLEPANRDIERARPNREHADQDHEQPVTDKDGQRQPVAKPVAVRRYQFRHDPIRHDTVRHDTVRHDPIRHDTGANPHADVQPVRHAVADPHEDADKVPDGASENEASEYADVDQHNVARQPVRVTYKDQDAQGLSQCHAIGHAHRRESHAIGHADTDAYRHCEAVAYGDGHPEALAHGDGHPEALACREAIAHPDGHGQAIAHPDDR